MYAGRESATQISLLFNETLDADINNVSTGCIEIMDTFPFLRINLDLT